MDLKTKTISELKALAYDVMAESERLREVLRAVNQEIANKAKEEKPKEDKKK